MLPVLFLFLIFLFMVFGLEFIKPGLRFLLITASVFCSLLSIVLAVNTLCWFRRFSRRKMQELGLRVGEANLLLAPHSVLMGCQTLNQLSFMFVQLEDCRRTFLQAPEGEALFREALLQFSCAYACCLVQAHFPHCEGTAAARGHLEPGLCFCQYVSV